MAPKRISKRSSAKKTVKRMSPKRSSVKRSSVKRSSVKRSSKRRSSKRSSLKRSSRKRMSNKKKLAIAAGAAGGLAAILAGRALYKNKDAVKASGMAAKDKVSGFFANIRSRFSKKPAEAQA